MNGQNGLLPVLREGGDEKCTVQDWVLTRLAKEETYLTNTFLQGTEKHHGVGHFFQVKLLVFVHFATPWMVRA